MLKIMRTAENAAQVSPNTEQQRMMAGPATDDMRMRDSMHVLRSASDKMSDQINVASFFVIPL